MTELTLGQLVQIARRWWWVLLIGPLLGGMLGWVGASRAEPLYHADAKLLLDRSSLSAGQDSSSAVYNDILAAERLTQTFGQLVTTRVVLAEALERMGDEAGDLTTSSLSDVLTVTVIPDTQIIQVEATAADPERAALIVNSVADVFADQAASIRPDVSAGNAATVQESIDAISEQMAETQAEIAALETSDDASTPAVQAQIRELRTQLGEDQSRHAELVEIQQRMELTAAESGVFVKIVDPAVAVDEPVSGNPAFLIFIGVLGGLALAGGVVFVLGYLDNTVKRPADVQRLTGRGTVGMIPSFDHPERFEALTDLRSAPAEAFRALRTNLQFATVGKVVRSLVMTSPDPGAGTTTTAAYLAMVLAQGGQRIILVDANLRRPSLHNLAGVANRSGLTTLLLGESLTNVEQHLASTDIPQLKVLPSGPLPPNPADLLNSGRMEDIIRHLELKADLVIFDSPSLRYADGLILTGMAGGALLVASAGDTRSNELADAITTLEQAGRPIFGTVLNNARIAHDGREAQSQFTTHNGYANPDDPANRRRRVPGFLSR